jgi:hypothetical protein
MWAFRFYMPWLDTVMACRRLSFDRKLGQRLRDDWYLPIHNSFSLIHARGWRLGNNRLQKNSLGGRRNIRNRRRNIPESSFVGWALLNGEHVN